MKGIAKKAAVVFCSVATVTSMAACGNSGGDSTASSDGKLSGEITFQTWNLKNDKYTSYFNDLISAFEKDNPGTTIKWVDQPSDGYPDKLSADAAAGTLPDVTDMGPNQAYSLAKAGALLNISAEDPSAKDNYIESAWNGVTFKGDGMDTGAYGLPWYLNTGPTFFNKSVLTKCGIDTEKLPDTYDGLFKLSDTMKKNCSGTSLMAKLPTIENFGEYGVQLMNDDQTEYTFNSKKGVEFVQHYIDMYKDGTLDGNALNADWTGETDAFKQGSVATVIGSLYSIGDFKENAKDVYDNLGLTKRIANTSGHIYMEMLAINAQTKNKDLALAFAKYVTNKENQVAFDKKANVFPSSVDSQTDAFFNPTGDTLEDEGMRLTAKEIENGTIWTPPQFSDALDVPNLREQIALAVQGKQTAQQALDKVVKDANDRLVQ